MSFKTFLISSYVIWLVSYTRNRKSWRVFAFMAVRRTLLWPTGCWSDMAREARICILEIESVRMIYVQIFAIRKIQIWSDLPWISLHECRLRLIIINHTPRIFFSHISPVALSSCTGDRIFNPHSFNLPSHLATQEVLIILMLQMSAIDAINFIFAL